MCSSGITWRPDTRTATTSSALRSTACARLSGMRVWIWSSRFITRFWTAGVSRNLIRELVQDYLFHLGIDVPPIDTDVHSATMLAEYVRLEREALEDPAAQEFWRRALDGSRATTLESDVAREAPATADPIVTVLIPQWLQDAAGATCEVSWTADEIAAARRALRDPAKTLGRVGCHDWTGHPRTSRTGRRRSSRRAVPQHRSRSGSTTNRRPGSTPSNTWPDSSARAIAIGATRCRPCNPMRAGPLFNTVFNYVNYHPFAELAGIAGIELLDFEVHEQTNFALLATVGIDPRTQRLFLRVNGDPQGVTADASTRIRRHIHACAGGNRALTRAGHRSRHRRVGCS